MDMHASPARNATIWVSWGPSGGLLSRLEGLRGHLEAVLGPLRALLGHFGSMLGRRGRVLGQLWGRLGRCGRRLRLSRSSSDGCPRAGECRPNGRGGGGHPSFSMKDA
eukprot:991340-Pyramimonas_sp.AAC.1